MRRTISIILSLVVCIAITAIPITGYAAEKSSGKVIKEISRGNTMGNLNNGGEIIKNGGEYYFYYGGSTRQEASGMDPEGLTEDEMKVFRKELDSNGNWWGSYWVVEPGIFAGKTDGSVIPRRITNCLNEKPNLYDAKFMNIDGENLYYVGTSVKDGLTHPNVICRASTKGSSSSKKLFTCKDSRDEIKKMAVMDDWIYYALYLYDKGINIYRMRLDGSDKALLAKNTTEYFDIDGNWLYFFKDTGIKRVELTNPKQEHDIVTTIQVVDDIIYYKDKLYFTYYKNVGVVPAKTGNSQKDIKILGQGRLTSVVNDKIYYTKQKNMKDFLYRMTLTGKSKKYIDKFDNGYAQLINGSVCYRSDIVNQNRDALDSLRYQK